MHMSKRKTMNPDKLHMQHIFLNKGKYANNTTLSKYIYKNIIEKNKMAAA